MEKVIDFLSYAALALLSLDTLRAILAMTGWVKPDLKYSWIIYGRYERNLIVSALKELGFEEKRSIEVKTHLMEESKKESNSYGITAENAAEQLIILIAKYIVHFDDPKQYGGTRTTDSRYYIDTMEMVHNEKDKKMMASIMALLFTYSGNTTKPGIIATPKGGNPLFAWEMSNYFSTYFIIVKWKKDKSRIASPTYDPDIDFYINYEGSWGVLTGEDKQDCVVVDCNTSGGSQLIDIVVGLRKVSEGKCGAKFKVPSNVYVLFRADNGSGHDVDIDKKFSDNGCKLFRFFDLDEEVKEKIYKFKESVGEDRDPDLYVINDKKQVDTIIQLISAKGKLFYDPKNIQKMVEEVF